MVGLMKPVAKANTSKPRMNGAIALPLGMICRDTNHGQYRLSIDHRVVKHKTYGRDGGYYEKNMADETCSGAVPQSPVPALFILMI